MHSLFLLPSWYVCFTHSLWRGRNVCCPLPFLLPVCCCLLGSISALLQLGCLLSSFLIIRVCCHSLVVLCTGLLRLLSSNTLPFVPVCAPLFPRLFGSCLCCFLFLLPICFNLELTHLLLFFVSSSFHCLSVVLCFTLLTLLLL